MNEAAKRRVYQRSRQFLWSKLALIFLVWMAGSVSVQAERFRSWTDMCQSRPCGTFPIDHVVVMFGEKRYDFPMRRLNLPDWYAQMRQRQVPEWVRYNWSAPGTPPRRGFSHTGFSIGTCCNEMFAWFGVTRPDQSALLQTGAQVNISFYPYPRDPRRLPPYYRLEYWLYGTETMYQPAIGPDDIPEHLRIDATPDFWRLPDHFGDLVLVSKKTYDRGRSCAGSLSWSGHVQLPYSAPGCRHPDARSACERVAGKPYRGRIFY